ERAAARLPEAERRLHRRVRRQPRSASGAGGRLHPAGVDRAATGVSGARPARGRGVYLARGPQLRPARSRGKPRPEDWRMTWIERERKAAREAAEQWFERDRLWFKRAVFYEIHIRGFFDANDAGAGDFRGLMEKLDYLEWLGVDCIWLLPMYESPL